MSPEFADGSKEDGNRLFSVSAGNKQGVKVDLKLKKGKFKLDIKKNFLTVRVVKHWNNQDRG